MINADTSFLTMINSPARKIKARVELLNGSTLVSIFQYDDALKSFTIERTGEASKFFGFGVCKKLNVKLIDRERKINITTANTFEVAFGVNSDFVYPCPVFYVTEVHRDENTNELSVTAYDSLHVATAHNVSELVLPQSYTIKDFADACATVIGLPIKLEGFPMEDTSFSTLYAAGANFDGSETIREALNAIAEATQSIYFINHEWELVFKRLDRSGDPVLEITKANYFTLNSSTNRRLSNITHATELGDNVSASTGVSGTTQYVRNNPFWDLREDIDVILENAVAAVGNLTINQFECNWRGNFLLEIGDKVSFVTKDNTKVTSFVLDDSVTYDGSFSEKTKWDYTDSNGETASNPTTLGEALKMTYARVDKANQEIELVASKAEDNAENISSLQINTEGISATVERVETNTNNTLENINTDLEELKNRVSTAVTAEDVQIQIETELANGVDSVTTKTGFTFNEEGLTVSKTGSEMTTQITEDGMTVYRNNAETLVADNIGVKALNLHAKTYLIIGSTSRFEDYTIDGEARTGCFWIGDSIGGGE